MRKIEKYNPDNGNWESLEFQELVDGDIFRIFDNEQRYVNQADGNNVWIATSNPYLNESKIWTISTLY
jgi:hypothetical protein